MEAEELMVVVVVVLLGVVVAVAMATAVFPRSSGFSAMKFLLLTSK